MGEGEVRGEEGERAAFNIILGSGFNSVCVPVPIYCYLSGRQAAFHSCVITPQGGDQKYARQRNAPLCTLPGKATTFVGLQRRGREERSSGANKSTGAWSFYRFSGSEKKTLPPQCYQNTVTAIWRIKLFITSSYISGTSGATVCRI